MEKWERNKTSNTHIKHALFVTFIWRFVYFSRCLYSHCVSGGGRWGNGKEMKRTNGAKTITRSLRSPLRAIKVSGQRENSFHYKKTHNWWMKKKHFVNILSEVGSLLFRWQTQLICLAPSPVPKAPLLSKTKPSEVDMYSMLAYVSRKKTIVFKIYKSSRGLCVPWGNLISAFSISTEGGLKKFPILCQRRVLDSNSAETSIGFFGCQQVLGSQFWLQRADSYPIMPDWLHKFVKRG